MSAALQLLQGSPRTMQELSVIYLTHLQERVARQDLSPRGLSSVRSYLNSFVQFVGPEMLLTQQRQYDITLWLKAHPEWRAKDTKRQAIGSVTGCFHWAEDEGLVEICVYRAPKSLKNEPSHTKRPATEREYKAVLRRGHRTIKWGVFFMWHTGVRTGELEALKWIHCDLHSECPHAELVDHKNARKTGRPRIIAFSPMIVKFLLWLKKRGTSQFVFNNRHHRPWRHGYFSRKFREVACAANLDFGVEDLVSPYCLRHSKACRLIEGGANPKQAADLLGSTPEILTRIYASSTRQRVAYLSAIAGMGK